MGKGTLDIEGGLVLSYCLGVTCMKNPPMGNVWRHYIRIVREIID